MPQGLRWILSNRNFRLWLGAISVSNLGTWLQRTAQEWLVLTELTNHDAAAVGWVMALQFGPQLVLLPWAGLASDVYDRRKLLLLTQGAMGLLALTLGLLTLAGRIQLWHVYFFALAFGCISALDAPARQAFVFELVGNRYLTKAVALSSTSFNGSRLIGPAAAGLCIATFGTAYAFIANGLSFVAVLIALVYLRTSDLQIAERASRTSSNSSDGLRCVTRNPKQRAVLIMLALIGMFGLNVTILVAAMAVRVFQTDAAGYGLLSSILALGGVSGALLSMLRQSASFALLPRSAVVFSAGLLLAALAPTFWLFAASLIVIGIATLTFLNASNGLMQLSTEPSMRGRVLAIRLAVSLGGSAIGAPLVGWLANTFGPRVALGIAAIAGLSAAVYGACYSSSWIKRRLS